MTLGHIFAKPKDPVKTNQKTHAVYSIPCGDCEKEYLGQSKRQFGTRLKEHQKAVSTLDKGKSALAEHVCYTNLVPRAFPFLSLGRREKALAPGGLLCILIGQ